MHMGNCGLRGRRMSIEDVGCAAIGHDCSIINEPSPKCGFNGMLTLSVHGHIQTLNLSVRAKYLSEMRLGDIFRKLLHHNL